MKSRKIVYSGALIIFVFGVLSLLVTRGVRVRAVVPSVNEPSSSFATGCDHPAVSPGRLMPCTIPPDSKNIGLTPGFGRLMPCIIPPDSKNIGLTPGLRSERGSDELLRLLRDTGGGTLDSVTNLVHLAQAHAGNMRQLMRSNPRKALEFALTFAEWERLPQNIRQLVEEPFSSRIDVSVKVACNPRSSSLVTSAQFNDGSKLHVYPYGSAVDHHTRRGGAAQGIRLGQAVVLRSRIFMPLEGDELDAVLKRFPVAVPKKNVKDIPALAGGKVFYFSSRTELEAAETAAREIAALPGPDVGLKLAALTGAAGRAASLSEARSESLAWTGSRRDMYVVRVAFPDIPDSPVDPVMYSNLLNTVVSQQISDMSYGRSYIHAIVDTNLYLMSQTSSNYNDRLDDNNTLWNEAVAAAEEQTGKDLTSTDSPYETVAVFHNQAAGDYLGLAVTGGRKLWITGDGAGAVTHELGHNYGCGHASFWDPLSPNPVNPDGTNIEYGSFVDIMGGGDMPAGHFNARLKNLIGWIPDGEYAFVTNSGVYRLYRSDCRATTGVPRGIKLRKDSQNYYWLGLRQNYNSEYDRFGRGLYLLWERPAPQDNKTFLLDMTPLSPKGKFDCGLAMGQTYADYDAGVFVTPLSHGGSYPDEWMDVAIELGDFAGNAVPQADITGPDSVPVMTSVLFRVTATDPDGDKLAYYWQTGDGLVYPDTSSVSVCWMVGGTVTVSCVVSDLRGGKRLVSKSVVVAEDPFAPQVWQALDSGQAHDLYAIASSPQGLLAVGDTAVVISPDGNIWDVQDAGAAGLQNAYMRSVLYDGSRFIVTGMDYIQDIAVGWVKAIWVSADGSAWDRVYMSPNPTTDDYPFMRAVAYDGVGVYVAVGDDGAVVRSTDASNWEEVPAFTTNELRGIAFGDGVFVAVGGPLGGVDHVFTSPDGLSWTNHSDGLKLALWRDLSVIKYSHNRFVAGGWYAGIQHSEDGGQTFKQAAGTADWRINALADGNGMLFAVGVDLYAATSNITCISLDGTRWRPHPAPSETDMLGATFFDDAFFMVGRNGEIWRSGPVPQTAGNGWSVWQERHFAALGAYRDAEDDADADGSLNWIEYACGTSPGDQFSEPALSGFRGSNGFFLLTLPWDGRRSDIDYQADECLNLVSNQWSLALIADETPTNITFSTSMPLEEIPLQYLRLRFQKKW